MKLYSLLVCFSCIVSGTSDSMLKLIYWNLKPYIFKENGTIKGILPDIMKLTEFYCSEHMGNYSKIVDFELELNTMNDFLELLHSNVSYGTGLLSNVTASNALWFPHTEEVSEEDVPFLKLRKVLPRQLYLLDKLVVIAPQNIITIQHKFMTGLYHCRTLLGVMLLFTILFSLLIWFFEHFNNPAFANERCGVSSKMFLKGIGTSMWFTFVTLTTVGYGDIVPRSVIAKCLTLVWMITALFISAVLTAAVTDTISDSTNAVSIYGKTVAVVNNSDEANIIENNYNATLLLTRSNHDAVAAVRSGKAFAAVMAYNVAVWHQLEIRGEYPQTLLTFVAVIPAHTPVNILINQKHQKLFKCMQMYGKEIIDYSAGKFKRELRIETLVYSGFSEMMENKFIFVVGIVTVVLTSLGLCHDLVMVLFVRKIGPYDNGNGEKNNNTEVNNNNNKKEGGVNVEILVESKQ